MDWKKVGLVAGIVLIPGGWLLGAYYLMTHCFHKTGNPITIDHKTYVVCSECGAEFEYDLKLMKMGAQRARYKHVSG